MKTSEIAPIALFVFRRPDHTRRTLEALESNVLASESDLTVFADGPRDSQDKELVEEVLEVVKSATGFRSVRIVKSEVNKGLANSIIHGVTKICEMNGRVIVLEDDLFTSPYFLEFMNTGLDVYANDDRVASIHGYTPSTFARDRLPSTFFMRGADCWGWATWKRAWAGFRPDAAELLDEIMGRGLSEEFNLGGAYDFTRLLRAQVEGRVDSWAIRWHASMFLASKFTLYPGESLVRHIGDDGSGTHVKNRKTSPHPLHEGRLVVEPQTVAADLAVLRKYERAMVNTFGSRRRKLLLRLGLLK